MATFPYPFSFDKKFVFTSPVSLSLTNNSIYVVPHSIADFEAYDLTNCYLKITGPDGIVFYQNPLYNSQSGYGDLYYDDNSGDPIFVESFHTLLPTDTTGAPLQGNYIVQMRVRAIGGLGNLYNSDFTWNQVLSYTTPTPKTQITFDYINNIVTGRDMTSYPENLTLTRVHTLYYPDGIQPTQPANIVSSNATNTTTPIYPGVWTDGIVSDMIIALGNYFFIVDTINVTSTSSAITIDICALQCGLQSLEQRYENTKCVNPTQAAIYNNQLMEITKLMMLFFGALNCGDTDKANEYYIQIQAVGEFTTDCSCSGNGSLVPLFPIGGSSDVIVVQGAGILVTSNTSAGITTYTVALSVANQVLLESLYNTTITESDSPLDIDYTADGSGNRTYTVVIADGGITTTQMADASITTAKIVDANVTTAKITDLNVTTAKINDLAVTTGKINDLAVTTGKINDLAVTAGKIDNNTITATQIANGTITATQLASNAVTTVKITDANVTPAKVTADINTIIVSVEIDLAATGTVNVPVFLDAWQLKQAVWVTKTVGAGGTVTLSIPSLGALGAPTGAIVYGGGAIYTQVASGIWTVNNTGFPFTGGVNTGVNVVITAAGVGKGTLYIKILKV